VLLEMARLFDERGNPKRALECIDDAMIDDDENATLFAWRATFLEHLGRREEAVASLDSAIDLEPDDRDLRRRRRRLA
jgi:predicted RNA polymerase sigma factor